MTADATDETLAAALAGYGRQIEEHGRHEIETIERIAEWRRDQLARRNLALQGMLDDQERLDLDTVRLLDTLRGRLGQLPRRQAAIANDPDSDHGYPPEIAYVSHERRQL